MSFRFITKSIHAYLIDYPVAIVLIAMPFVLNLGQSGPLAMWLSAVVGVAALLLAGLTDHPTGFVPIIPLLAAPLGGSRSRGGVCLRTLCLQIRWDRRLVLLDPRCRCPVHDVGLERT
ncbi:hypothetical protein ACVWW4_000638 [Bradyrhizobium sp. LB7.1]